jgi:hypothetical protein
MREQVQERTVAPQNAPTPHIQQQKHVLNKAVYMLQNVGRQARPCINMGYELPPDARWEQQDACLMCTVKSTPAHIDVVHAVVVLEPGATQKQYACPRHTQPLCTPAY